MALPPTTVTPLRPLRPAPPTFAMSRVRRKHRRLRKASTLIATRTQSDTATPAAPIQDLTSPRFRTARPARPALEVTTANGVRLATAPALRTPALRRAIPKRTRPIWLQQSVFSAAHTEHPRVVPLRCPPTSLLFRHFRPNTRTRPLLVLRPVCHTRARKTTLIWMMTCRTKRLMLLPVTSTMMTKASSERWMLSTYPNLYLSQVSSRT